nr:MAG TPA_asm: hypothetical protein [Caudoviricetes sp.]
MKRGYQILSHSFNVRKLLLHVNWLTQATF